MLASGSSDKTVKVWDAQTGEQICAFAGHQDSVLSVAYFPHGRIIFSAGFDNLLKFWDAETGKELCSLPGLKEEVVSAALSPDGWTIATGDWDETIKLWRSWLPFTMEDVELMSGCTVYGSGLALLSAEREQELLRKARKFNRDPLALRVPGRVDLQPIALPHFLSLALALALVLSPTLCFLPSTAPAD